MGNLAGSNPVIRTRGLAAKRRLKGTEPFVPCLYLCACRLRGFRKKYSCILPEYFSARLRFYSIGKLKCGQANNLPADFMPQCSRELPRSAGSITSSRNVKGDALWGSMVVGKENKPLLRFVGTYCRNPASGAPRQSIALRSGEQLARKYHAAMLARTTAVGRLNYLFP